MFTGEGSRPARGGTFSSAVLTVLVWALAIGPATGCGDDGAATATDASSGDAAPDAAIPPNDLARYVDPLIGTDDSSSPNPVPGGAGGSTYPGAVVPFGMVQLSPDTPTASPSGYRASDTSIEQFSVTHFDGAGCSNNEDLPFLPMVGDLTASPGTTWPLYASSYSKESEVASPGYYAVHLDAYDVDVELTATTRTGFARFVFPPSDVSRVLVYTGRDATGVHEGNVEIVGPDRIRGTIEAGNFCGSRQMFSIYFVAVFDRPSLDYGTWMGSLVSPGSSISYSDVEPTGAYLTFDTSIEPVVQMKVAISYVSIENAEANLAAESPAWDFGAARDAARSAWNDVLGRVRVTGGSDEDLEKFYTALYHVFQSPNVANDVNGEYMGFDGRVHTASDWTVYQNYSGWDIIRSWTHLVAAIAPETPDIIRSMVQDGIEGGLLPFWTHQNVETRVMVGDPGTVNVANAYAMGVRGFDEVAALELMRKSADDPTDTQRWALSDWIDRHYAGNAAVSEEYAMADFALARYAQGVGDEAAYSTYMARSDYWRESWNAADGYIEPRVATPSPGAYAARLYEVQVFGPGAPATNLARAGTATASSSCTTSEGPEKAINGTWTDGPWDKWCDNRSVNKWWRLDLGSTQTVDRVVVYHAGAGGEASAWNTQDFGIEVSTDGAAWTTVATITGNTASMTMHAITPVDARYIRIVVTTPIQVGVTGEWDCQPLDPGSQCGFVEGNAAQYLWMVPHNLEGLFTLLGGRDAAIARLDELFTELNAGTSRPYFYIGNEPEHGTPWTYDFAGAPWKTQEVVRRIIDEEFNTTPGGLPGNDDLGATSAWLVWAYLGLYPVIPGTDVLVLNGPAFESATITLANGSTLTIRGNGAGAGAPYIQSLSVDGAPATKTFVRYADIAGGSTLDFTMGSEPNRAWGSGPEDAPPSFAP